MGVELYYGGAYSQQWMKNWAHIPSILSWDDQISQNLDLINLGF